MRIIEQLVYKIQGDNSEFDRSIDKSETKVNKFGSVADKMLAGVTVAAIGMVIKKMGDMVISSATALDRVDKLSQKIGLSRVAFQEWDYVLGQSDASVEGLQMGIKTLSNAADEARKGTALYAEAFDKLGVSVTDTNGNMKDQETLFAEVFSALADMENQTERTAIANKLLGRSATELAPALNTSKEEIEGLRQEAHDLGLVYSDELVDAGVVLGDNIDRLKKSFDAFKTNALAPIIGLAVTFTDKLLGQGKGTTELEKQTRNLTTQSVNYKNIISQLQDPMDVLTEAEKARLGILKQIQSQNLEDTIYQTSRAYKESANAVKQAKVALEELEIKQSAYTLVTNDFASAQQRLKELNQNKNRTTQEELELGNLRTALMDTEFQRQTEILSLTGRINEQRTTAESLNKSYESSLRAISEAVADGAVNINQYALTNVDFYNAVMDNVKALNEEREAVKFAEEEYKRYANSTLTEVTARIYEFQQASELSMAGQYALQKLLQRKQEIEASVAKTTEDLALKEQARIDIIKTGNESLQVAERYALALGDSYDLNAQKASILETTIKSLIDSGLTAEDEAVSNLVAQLKALAPATEDVTEAQEDMNESVSENTNIISNAQKAYDNYKSVIDNLKTSLKQAEEFEKLYGDQFDLNAEKATILKGAIDSLIKLGFNASSQAVQELVTQLEALGDTTTKVANTNIIPAAQVAFDTWRKEQERTKNEAEKLAEDTAKAWEDATFSMLGSVTSIWGSINQVQANQNEEEIQRIEEQNAIAIQAAKDRGASEEELTNLEKSLQADLNDTKNQYAQEEAKRQKAQATFSAIIDTARAVIGFLANPGGWAGVGLSAAAVGVGAAQLAAINSAPVPSFDVGSIRIPETTQAVVHKDEMILTAPQAEQARREGITIAPTKNGGNSVNLVIYLDGKEIARNTIDNLNSGSVGTIKARVVK